MFNAATRRWIQAVLLLLLGLYFLDNMLSGRIYFYINERFGWLSWLATVIFIALGVVGIADALRQQREERAHQHEDHDGHDHEHDHHHEHEDHDHAGHTHGAVPWPRLVILAVPLIVGLVVPSKPLGASAVGTSGVSTTFTSLAGSGSASQLSTVSTDRNVLDWVKGFNNSANVDEFGGQQADVIGFVYSDIRFKDQPRFMVARFTISCCVADASAIGVITESADATKLAQDSWVHVTGKFKVEDLAGQKTPVLIADKIEPVKQPDQPYLYP